MKPVQRVIPGKVKQRVSLARTYIMSDFWVTQYLKTFSSSFKQVEFLHSGWRGLRLLILKLSNKNSNS